MRISVADDTAKHRYEAHADGKLAGFITYELRDGSVAMLHTQVSDAYAGKGIGSALVKGALGRVADAGSSVLPYCPFVAGYLQRHPELQGLVPEQRRAEFGLDNAAVGEASTERPAQS